MSTKQDPARLIAERVARRLGSSAGAQRNESKPGNGTERMSERPRARVIDFISPAPPAPTQSSISSQQIVPAPGAATPSISGPRVTQSPWLAPFARPAETDFSSSSEMPLHPSQERFGVEEAAVSELVEFFENEKQCSVDPSGKPCDHCAMCSSRGF